MSVKRPQVVHDSSTVNITVKKICQDRKKKNLARDCWTVVPVTNIESSQPLLKLCRRLLINCTSDCWTIVPVTVEQYCQSLLRIRGSRCWRINATNDCWSIVPVTVEQLRQCLLRNHASGCWTFVPKIKMDFLRNFTDLLLPCYQKFKADPDTKNWSGKVKIYNDCLR